MSLLVALASMALGLGDGWVSDCDVDEFTDQRRCSVDWIDRYQSHRRADAYMLSVARIDGRLQLSVIAGGTQIPGRLDVRVDDNAAAQTDKCLAIGCILDDSEGERIVQEMAHGSQLRVRVLTVAHMPELEVLVPLAGFASAFSEIE